MATVFRRRGRNGRRSNVWTFKYRNYQGKWVWGLGWPDRQRTLEHALSMEAEARAIARGEKAPPERWLKNRNKPIGEALDEFMQQGSMHFGWGHKGWAPAHAKKKHANLAFWIERLRLHVLGDIELSAVEQVAAELVKQGLSNKTVSMRVADLKGLCSWAVKRNLLGVNPLTHMQGFDIKAKCPHRPLTDEEVRRLLETAPPDRGLWYRTALQTGFREMELKSLSVGSLDVFGPSLTLDGAHTKNRRDCRIYVTRQLTEELGKLTAGRGVNEPLFNMPCGTTIRKYLGEDFDRARIIRENEQGRATFHSFRTTYINAVVQSGGDLKSIMEASRHSSAAMTFGVYARPDASRLRKVAEAVAGRVKAAIASKNGALCGEKKVVGSSGVVGSISQDNELEVVTVVGDGGFEPPTSWV